LSAAWRCEYCGCLNPIADREGFVVALCEHCAARRGTGDEERSEGEAEEEGRYFWSTGPIGTSITCSYLSPAESWSSTIHESEIRSVNDYYGMVDSFLSRNRFRRSR